MGQFRFNLTHYLDVSPVLRVLNGMVRSLIIAASLLIADGTAAQVVSWTDTQLVVIAPSHEGLGAGGSVTVTQISGSATAANAFTLVAGVPTLGAITAGMAIVFLLGVALVRLR